MLVEVFTALMFGMMLGSMNGGEMELTNSDVGIYRT